MINKIISDKLNMYFNIYEILIFVIVIIFYVYWFFFNKWIIIVIDYILFILYLLREYEEKTFKRS